MKATTKIKTKAKTKTKAEAKVKTAPKKGPAEQDPQVLVDRHGRECGYIIYSLFLENDILLDLNQDAPRLITLKTWKKWAAQATAYRKAMKKNADAYYVSQFNAAVERYPLTTKSKKKKKKGGK